MSKSFILLTTTKRGAKKIRYRAKPLKAAGVSLSLLKRELRHFLSNPMLILNMSLASIFVLLAGLVLLVKPDLIKPVLTQLGAVLPGVSPPLLCAVLLTSVACLNTAAAALVSLEGKSLWILQSLPVRPVDILTAKVNLHLTVCGAPVLLSSLCCGFAFGGGLADVALLLALPLLFSVLMGFAGVTLNLLLPKFDWLSELQPAKQGMAVMLTMFGAMALVIVLALLYIFVFSAADLRLFLTAVAFLAALGSALLYLYLSRAGARRFAGLEG
jgi:ABC-2 type transport system permease protein